MKQSKRQARDRTRQGRKHAQDAEAPEGGAKFGRVYGPQVEIEALVSARNYGIEIDEKKQALNR